MGMKRLRWIPILLTLAAAGIPGFGADLEVDLKNDGATAVSVRAGTDNGVTRGSDFEIVISDNLAVRIYPVDVYNDRFWSQPLYHRDYEQVKPGMPVRPVTLDPVSHQRLRAEGDARRKEFKARQDEARKVVLRKKLEDLQDRRERLIERRDALDDSVSRAEADLSDEEGRVDWLRSGYDDDIDRSLRKIGELADQRDELQAQRDVLSRQRPFPKGEIDRLTTQIRSLNGQIDTERNRIRTAREQKRSARSSYLSRKQDWQKLVAERNGVQTEIRQVDQKIREVSAQLSSAGARE